MTRRWTYNNRYIFDPNGKLHSAMDNASALVARLNADMDDGIRQTWMPGVPYMKEEQNAAVAQG